MNDKQVLSSSFLCSSSERKGTSSEDTHVFVRRNKNTIFALRTCFKLLAACLVALLVSVMGKVCCVFPLHYLHHYCSVMHRVCILYLELSKIVLV